jgi:hypothetical protein
LTRRVGEIFIVPLSYKTGYYETPKAETPLCWGVYRQGDGFIESVDEHILSPSKYNTEAEAIVAAARARLKG